MSFEPSFYRDMQINSRSVLEIGFHFDRVFRSPLAGWVQCRRILKEVVFAGIVHNQLVRTIPFQFVSYS